MLYRKLIFGFMLIFLMINISVKPAFAMDKTILDEKQSIMPANEKVDNIVVFGHDIDIKGQVDTSAVVINGNLKIDKTARINGIVLVINGDVVQEPGSFVKDNILAFKFKSDTLNHLLIGAALLLSSWLLRFVVSVCTVLLSVLVGLLLKNKGNHSIRIFKQQLGRLILVGAVACLALMGVIALLIISVIGIPLAIILVFPPLIAFLVGFSILSHYLGSKLFSNLNVSNWVTTFVGSFLLAGVFNFPFFGFLVFISIFCISNGLMILWLLKKLDRRFRLKKTENNG